MAQTWYPVIDYVSCIECGTCSAKCPHGVYDLAKAPAPVVSNPLECIDHCHGCGNRCPVGAITYVGDNTGWTPPNGSVVVEETCCCCAESAPPVKKAVIEYLYLDLKTCDRCIGTENILDGVLAVLTPALELAGYSVAYRKTEMLTAELAEQNRFLSSPTIRVNGLDVCESVQENNCGCCGEISGTQVDCRVFSYQGETYEVPPAAMLAESILKALFADNADRSSADYQMPQNLKEFYQGKEAKESCGGGCCCDHNPEIRTPVDTTSA